MSLLFYDFNGSSTSNNNPKNCKKIMQAHPSQNIADLVIPEEDIDGGMPGNKHLGEGNVMQYNKGYLENDYSSDEDDEENFGEKTTFIVGGSPQMMTAQDE